MAKSTMTKDVKTIARIRDMAKRNIPLKAIARQIQCSINTVRKIVRRNNGYEKQTFDHTRWKGRIPYCPTTICPIDGETLYIQKSGSADDYPRITSKGNRSLLHIYLARKVYAKVGRAWPVRAIVHHIDNDQKNFELKNLAVFNCIKDHLLHHKRII